MAMDISKLQAHVVTLCIAYYEMDGETLIGDWGYKTICDILYARQRLEYANMDELIMSTRLGYATASLDISTGYDVPDKLTESDRRALTETAKILLAYKNGDRSAELINRAAEMWADGTWLI